MWGVDLTFSSPINETLSGSAWVGYGNNGLLNVFESDFTPEFLVGLRFNWRPSANSEAQIGADTSLANADLYASRRAKSSTGDWSGTVNITQTPGYGALLNTSLSNRNAYGATLQPRTGKPIPLTRIQSRICPRGRLRRRAHRLRNPPPSFRQTPDPYGRHGRQGRQARPAFHKLTRPFRRRRLVPRLLADHRRHAEGPP